MDFKPTPTNFLQLEISRQFAKKHNPKTGQNL
jgi:hypothetical protein